MFLFSLCLALCQFMELSLRLNLSKCTKWKKTEDFDVSMDSQILCSQMKRENIPKLCCFILSIFEIKWNFSFEFQNLQIEAKKYSKLGERGPDFQME